MSGGFEHPLRPMAAVRDRDQELLRLCAGRSVVHVGCTDAPFTAEKLADGSLLHAKLLGTAADAVGVDIDDAGLTLLRAQLGGNYVSADVSTDSGVASVPAAGASVVLAGDVVEHVVDEGSFLRGLAALARAAGRDDCTVVVSTPNALAIRNVVYTGFNREVIHPDHRRVHTPQTLRYALSGAGLDLVSLTTYAISSGTSLPRRVSDALSRGATRLRTGYGDGLIAVARVGR